MVTAVVDVIVNPVVDVIVTAVVDVIVVTSTVVPVAIAAVGGATFIDLLDTFVLL